MNQPRLFPIYAKEPLLTECEINKVAEYLTGIKPEGPAKKSSIQDFDLFKGMAVTTDIQSKLGKLDAGYTYFGQFISHEIVPCSNPKPSEHAYTTTPELDLKSLYGEPSQYSTLFDEEGKFKTNQTDLFDVIRDKNHVAIIPDQRNDENAIILQFHVLWQNIHNKIVEELKTPALNNKCEFDHKAIHKKARQTTTSLFHYLTIYDFAARLLHPDVFKSYFDGDKRVTEHNKHCQQLQTIAYLYNENSSFDAIPVEFSHAVFRFGHSMVRDNYDLGVGEYSTQKDIFTLFRPHPKSALCSKLKIENWGAFFGSQAQRASLIELGVTSDMGRIPLAKHIVKLNLMAGNRAKVPSGYWIKDWINTQCPNLKIDCKFNKDKELTPSPFGDLRCFNSLLSKHYNHRFLPLWLYTLQEARLEQPSGQKLGRVSSVVIAEVLRQSILKQQSKDTNIVSYSHLKQWMISTSEPIFTKWLTEGELTMQTLLTHLNLIEEKNNAKT